MFESATVKEFSVRVTEFLLCMSQQAHNFNTTSPQRRCNVMMLHHVVAMLYKRHVPAGVSFFFSPEYLQVVVDALATTGTQCNAAINDATQTMAQWWNQPDKRKMLFTMFK